MTNIVYIWAFGYHDKAEHYTSGRCGFHEKFVLLLQCLIQTSLHIHCFSYSSVYLPFAVPISPLCDLPEYRWCLGAKHPLGLQQSQTEGSGGGRRREKWQTRTWGILGATKNSTEKRRAEWWRVCRHNDEGNIGWVIFSCFKNELFCTRNRKKKGFYSWVHVPFSQIKRRLF